MLEQWIPRAIEAGWLKDITAEVGGPPAQAGHAEDLGLVEERSLFQVPTQLPTRNSRCR